MTLQEEIDRQVQAGMCVRGPTATGCLLADGSEAACQTIRECAPSQHFEYALPGSTPNKNIWLLTENGLVWTGSTQTTPVSMPGIGIDPISGSPNPFVNYDAIPYVPPPTYGPGYPQPNLTNVPRGPGNGTTTTGGSPIAPAYGNGLQQDLDTYLQATLGRVVVNQVEFCGAYQRLTGFACDFDTEESGSKESRAWLAQLQSLQNSRVSPIGNRPLPGYQTPIGGGTPPPTTGGGPAPVAGLGGLFSNPIMLIIVIVVIAVMVKKG